MIVQQEVFTKQKGEFLSLHVDLKTGRAKRSQLYNQDFSTHNIHNVDKSKSYKTINHNFIDNNLYNKKQSINNDITNYITKK